MIENFNVNLEKTGKMQEAAFYQTAPEGKVKCLLCPHHCLISEGLSGTCNVRVNRDGKLFSLVYGQPAALHSDPIEKKPLYHFYPGRQILSIGTKGCNLRCSHCQNYSISQCAVVHENHGREFSPSLLVKKAVSLPGNLGIAYTYNEPTIFYEYMVETAEMIHAEGMKNVMVSNGFIEEEPLLSLIPHIDAFNIDLKSFSDKFYRDITGGRLKPVMRTLQTIAAAGKHLEITLLVIPALNDGIEEFTMMRDWIASELGSDTPLHLSRYFPAYKMALPPTTVSTLLKLAGIAREELHFVYTGNMADDEYSSTYCPNCNNCVIERSGYHTNVTGLTNDSSCTQCGKLVAVIM